ncbi:AP complex, mu/sigma subunit [Globomyces pollinis-pini]|nr:AP complex, mu/sigma subunit [Globomyces pollinis-pini]
MMDLLLTIHEINWIIVFSKLGKIRLRRWYRTVSLQEKTKVVSDVIQQVLPRSSRLSSFLEYKDTKVVYRRYASLYFCVSIDAVDNELLALEIIHRFVQALDTCFGNVTELDVLFG